MSSEIKQRAALTILERGVRVATLAPSLKYTSRGVPGSVDVIIYQPTMGELIEISGIVAAMDLTLEQLAAITLPESYQVLASHGRDALRALQVATRFRFEGLTDSEALELLATIPPADFSAAWSLLIKHSGVADFIDSTRLMIQIDILNPQTRGSGQPTEQ